MVTYQLKLALGIMDVAYKQV